LLTRPLLHGGWSYAFCGGGGMHGPELQRKNRPRIEELADKQRSTELSLLE
jgi:hypothetical protein